MSLQTPRVTKSISAKWILATVLVLSFVAVMMPMSASASPDSQSAPTSAAAQYVEGHSRCAELADPQSSLLKMHNRLLDRYCDVGDEAQSAADSVAAAQAQDANDGRLAVEIIAGDNVDALLRDLEDLGATHIVAYQNIVNAIVPVDALGTMAASEHLRFVSIPENHTNAATGQHVPAHDIATLMAAPYNLDGTGVKVGIVSDSFDCITGGMASDIATGDLPPASRIHIEWDYDDAEGNCNGATDEGRAIAQVIYDVAPSVEIYFHTAWPGKAGFATAIDNLAAIDGMDIIVDDILNYTEMFYQDDIVAQAVDNAHAAGISYFVSAGNSYNDTWEGSLVDTNNDYWLEFDSSPSVTDQRLNITVPAGNTLLATLMWDNPIQNVTADLNFYLMNPGATHWTQWVARSSASNVGSHPWESLSYWNNSASARQFELWVYDNRYSVPDNIKIVIFNSATTIDETYAGGPTIIGHFNAAGAITVGAANYWETPGYGQDPALLWAHACSATDVCGSGSSWGGVPIFFDASGNTLATPEIRNKPDVVAAHNVNTTFFGVDDYGHPVPDADSLPNFYGTSAAAPVAAAIGALVLDAEPTTTNTELYDCINNTADDMGTSGFDHQSGNGFVDAEAAVQCADSSLYDWGDLPDNNDGTTTPSYPTNSTNGGEGVGPSHVIVSTLQIGVAIDDETDGQPNAAADGDDNNGDTPNDEDGVTLPTFFADQPGTVAVDVTNSTGADATLYGFIDWNGDGSFDDAGETASTIVPTGTSGDAVVLTFDVPLDADTTKNLGARFRLSSDTGLGPDGPASNGEVEDYLTTVTPVGSLGSFVWEDLNSDGVQNDGEPGIAGATVHLLDFGTGKPLAEDAAGNPVLPIVTGSDGYYHFQNLPAGIKSYYVEVTPPAGYVPTAVQTTGSIDGSTNTSNSDSNIASNPSPGVYRSGVINSLTNNGEQTGETQAGGAADNPGDANADDNNGNMTVDFGFVEPAAIGNYVWVDENSDGVQDEGEPGIPGVVVQLTPPARIDLGSGAGVAISTVTDSHGGYLFDHLPPLASGEQYVVTVPNSNWNDNAGPLDDMFQTPLTTDPDGIDGDFGNKDDGSNDGSGSTVGYAIGTLGPGEENLTADFGYNHNTNDEVNNGTGNAALGDRVWIDSDGDGVQDPNEVGVKGAYVSLIAAGPDGLFGTFDDDTVTSTPTDVNGYYRFDDLAPGVYQVQVVAVIDASHDVLNTSNYAQTGDPDHFGTDTSNVLPGGLAGDNLSTIPVLLGPGDVFLNVDFGYQPTAAAALGSIGDTVFFDADADGNGPSMADVDAPNGENASTAVTQGAGGTDDSTDYGIAGVSVALIKETSGDGFWDYYEPIIATAVTDENGQYLFVDLPITDGAGTDDYLVWVNDTDNVLDGLVGTYDSDGGMPSTESGAPSWSGAGGEPAAILGLSAVSDLDDDATPANADRGQDFGYSASNPVGSIGDTVWYDVDGTGGAIQDPGEPGLPGVTVKLYTDPTPGNPNSGDEVLAATTTTDAAGNYLFSNLPLGSYTVEVDDTTLPSGVTWSQTYDQDAPTNDDRSSTTLTEAVPHDRDQDFSYTQDSPTVYSVGDTVWYDVNNSGGDQGSQGNEPGIAGVTVALLDSSGAIVATAVTDGDGYYLFTELAADDYEVVVDTSTLPGYVSTTSTHERDGADSGSRTSLTLGGGGELNPRDVDFSYPPAATPTTGTIGDTIWHDVNGLGGATQDIGEPGLPNVTVRLYVDDDDSSGTPPTLVGTTTTDEHGNYLFTDLPLTDGSTDGNPDYVVVADTATLPPYVNTVPSYDPDGGDNSQSAVELSVGSPVDLDQDFSYPGSPARGAIGDTVWFDVDGSTGPTQGDEPGIEGVVMELLDAGGNVIATTSTDENGNYFFGNLPLNVPYQVRVATSNTQSGGVLEGMSNTYDPDQSGGGDGVGPQITLTAVAPVNLDQDFSYAGDFAAGGSIGNRIWLDQDADGIYEETFGPDLVPGTDDDERGIAGVTIDLYRDLNGNGLVDPGEPLMGSTTTAADGTYLFEGLPTVGSGATGGATYVVDVTDEDGVLNGYWHSLSPTQDPYTNMSGDMAEDANDNSKADPFGVEIGGTNPIHNRNVDFGYYVEPAAVGNYIWVDTDKNGLQDDGETGLNGVEVQMKITYPDTTVTTLTMLTQNDSSGNSGWYSFGNLLLDEDYNDAGGAAEPTYAISVDIAQPALASYTPTTIDVNTATNDLNDSDEHSGVSVSPVQGLTDTSADDPVTDEAAIASYDFGVFPCVHDWGDLPGVYPTEASKQGASHCIIDGLHIGTVVNDESDGQPDQGDDGVNGDTDEGVDLASAHYSADSKVFTINVDVVNTTAKPAQLVGWMDFSNNGAGDDDLTDANERSLPAVIGVTGTAQQVADATDGSFETGNIPAGFSGTVTLMWTNVVLPENPSLLLYSRFRLTHEPSFFSDSSPQPTGRVATGEVEDWVVKDVILAVSLSHVDSQRSGDSVEFIWETATETGNAGFNLYMEVGDELVPVNPTLIPSTVIDSLSPVYYSHTAKASGERYYIEMVDIHGDSERYGPFTVGINYGAPSTSSSMPGGAIYLPVIMK